MRCRFSVKCGRSDRSNECCNVFPMQFSFLFSFSVISCNWFQLFFDLIIGCIIRLLSYLLKSLTFAFASDNNLFASLPKPRKKRVRSLRCLLIFLMLCRLNPNLQPLAILSRTETLFKKSRICKSIIVILFIYTLNISKSMQIDFHYIFYSKKVCQEYVCL